mmetsp:Transcript_53840/g.109506  ORF Transcript_53840/g.109506 Transcript_53840/m.109506 type:complete len:306 (-) Transcript_53840:1017-1934(-)
MGSPPTAECMRASSCVREGSAKKRRPDDTDGGANMAGLGSVGAATGMVDTRGAVPYARAESAALAEAWPFTAAAVGVGPDLRFSSRWLDSRSLLVSAAIRDSSPASTLAATTRARLAAFSPGFSVAAPRTPRSSRHAAWAGSVVPPPTVPTSTDGMVTDMSKSSPERSMSVMQLEDSTFWAASWPVARYTAVTRLEAWALKPPTEPAMAEPMRFLLVFSAIMGSTSVFSTRFSTSRLMMVSTTTDLPRPLTQLMADGFLSVHMLPDKPLICMPGNSAATTCSASLTPLVIMFMPMASPVKHWKRR